MLFLLLSIDNSAVEIPTVHIPLWCSLHIKPVVDGEFLAFKHIKASGDGWYESVTGMFRIRPLAVCNEAVVQLVRQGRGVVLGGMELRREVHVVSSFSASFCPFYKDCVASVAVWCPLLLCHSDPIVEGYQRPCWNVFPGVQPLSASLHLRLGDAHQCRLVWVLSMWRTQHARVCRDPPFIVIGAGIVGAGEAGYENTTNLLKAGETAAATGHELPVPPLTDQSSGEVGIEEGDVWASESSIIVHLADQPASAEH